MRHEIKTTYSCILERGCSLLLQGNGPLSICGLVACISPVGASFEEVLSRLNGHEGFDLAATASSWLSEDTAE